jgi:hypothetical protein
MFTTPDDLVMDFLLDNKCVKWLVPNMFDNLPVKTETTPGHCRPDDASYHSFGTEFGKSNNTRK